MHLNESFVFMQNKLIKYRIILIYFEYFGKNVLTLNM